jgi:hypothetical protein
MLVKLVPKFWMRALGARVELVLELVAVLKSLHDRVTLVGVLMDCVPFTSDYVTSSWDNVVQLCGNRGSGTWGRNITQL